MSGAREAILSRIRAATSPSGADGLPERTWPRPARALGDAPALRDRFVAFLEEAGATVATVGTPAAVAAEVARYLQAAGLPPSIVAAAEPGLDGCGWEGQAGLAVRRGVPGPDDAASVTAVVAGIAETGSLMVCSAPGTANALHFLPDTHIVVVPAEAIVGDYEDAFARLFTRDATIPRNVTLITGPSRSSDIERILQIGVHGPRALHVIVTDGP